MKIHHLSHGLCDPRPNCHKSSLFTVGLANGVLATVALRTLNRLRKIENGRKFKNIRNQRFGNHPSQQYKIFTPEIDFWRSWAEPSRSKLARAGRSRPEEQSGGFSQIFKNSQKNIFQKKDFGRFYLPNPRPEPASLPKPIDFY